MTSRSCGWPAALRQGLAALAVMLLVSPADAREPWSALSRGSLTVRFRDADRAAASRFLDVAEASVELVEAEMGRGVTGALTVVVASSEEEWRELTGGSIPDWGIGTAHPERSLVVVKSPRIVTYPLEMETVVLHEIAHVAAGRLLGDAQVPRWFDEGIAMVVADEWRVSESALLAGAVITRTDYPLAELAWAFPRGARGAALAYAESFQAVRFLMQESGLESPGALLAAVAERGDFDRALTELTGRSPGRFGQDFRSWLGRRFAWGTALAGTGTAFLAATCVFLFAAAAKASRTRRRLRELADEEGDLRPRSRGRTGSSWL